MIRPPAQVLDHPSLEISLTKCVTEVAWLDMLWLNIHMRVSILCACLPTMRPLVLKAASLTASLRQKYGSSKSKGSSKTSPSYQSSEPQKSPKRPEYVKMEDQGRDKDRLVGARSVEQILAEDDMPFDGIKVKKTVDVV